MRQVKKALLEELYNLNSERLKIEDDVADEEVSEAQELVDSRIHNRLTEITITMDADTTMIVWGLLVGIGHLTISRFFKCIEVCGIEIEE